MYGLYIKDDYRVVFEAMLLPHSVAALFRFSWFSVSTFFIVVIFRSYNDFIRVNKGYCLTSSTFMQTIRLAYQNLDYEKGHV